MLTQHGKVKQVLKTSQNTVCITVAKIFLHVGSPSTLIFPLSGLLLVWPCYHHPYCLVVAARATEVRHVCLLKSIPEGNSGQVPILMNNYFFHRERFLIQFLGCTLQFIFLMTGTYLPDTLSCYNLNYKFCSLTLLYEFFTDCFKKRVEKSCEPV